jgi:dinuclear metal center YbgI/SA1388 family protein
MLKISDITAELEKVAPPSLQEDYDNSGLITGEANTLVTNALVCLDCTEAIIDEAIQANCNLVIAHHPIVFKGLKRLNGNNYVERTIIKAIRNQIAIYAIHTNLDNVLYQGVNSKIAEKLGLHNCRILDTKDGKLAKMVTFVPLSHADEVRNALFEAGTGKIGNYDACSFNTDGYGTYRGNENSNAFAGKKGELHREAETRIETIFPLYLKSKVVSALLGTHPYEEVAYDITLLQNTWKEAGSGMIGELQTAIPPEDFLELLKRSMQPGVIKFTPFANSIKRVAICGGSGSFLLRNAIAAGADAFVTSDFKYHDFFDAENKLMICDIGHYESEQFTPELIIEILRKKFVTFAPVLAKTNTNPVNYYS